MFFSFENLVTRTIYKLIKTLEYFYVQHTLSAMSDKRKYMKNSYAGKKKACNKPTKSFPNMTKVRITTKGNRSMDIKMEKGGIIMNITMMTLIM